MSYKSDDDKSMGLCMNNFILYTDVPPRMDMDQTQCNVSSTTHIDSNLKTFDSIELDSSRYHTITDIVPENPIQKKLVSSSYVDSLEGEYSDCDMATLMTLGKDIILVCSNTDSSQELEDISENRYIPIKPKPEKSEDLNCEEPAEYDVFWACTICSLDCPSQDHLRDHLLNHSVIELSDAITLSTEPMFRKKILTIDEPDPPSEVVKDQQENMNHQMEPETNISPGPIKPSKRHMRKKDGLRSRDPHACHVCGKVLSSRGNLSKHLIIHNAEKPFSCDICKATFNAKRDKDLHYIQHHTNKRDSVCEICGKGFSCRRLLQEHYTSHDTSSSFPCPKCGKCFQTKKSLKQHIKRHNNTKSYHCDICFKIFKVKYDLRGHMRKVHSVKDFSIKDDSKCLNDTSLANTEHLLEVNPLLTEDPPYLSQPELGQQIEDSVTTLIESDFPGDSNMLMTSTDRSFLVDPTDLASHKGLIFFPNQSVPEFMERSDGVDLGDVPKEDLIPSQEVPQTFVIVKMEKNVEDTENSLEPVAPDQTTDEPENSVSDQKSMKNIPSILRRPRKS